MRAYVWSAQSWSMFVTWIMALCWIATSAQAQPQVLRYFPVGPIYEYRWQLLQLALDHTSGGAPALRLAPFTEDITQNRGVQLRAAGNLDVLALGSNAEREADLLPIRVDILKGMVGFRVFLIRQADQQSIASMDDAALRHQLTFGLNGQWADVPIMLANGLTVTTATRYENLFGMLAAGRFNAFPRGLNEAAPELAIWQKTYPQLQLEQTKALYFPYPIYFWVNKHNSALAQRIERGLRLALADGSFRRLFETSHANAIAMLKNRPRHVLLLTNPWLPPGVPEPDTQWWWPHHTARQHP